MRKSIKKLISCCTILKSKFEGDEGLEEIVGAMGAGEDIDEFICYVKCRSVFHAVGEFAWV